MGVISIVNGDYKPTNITGGAPPCRNSGEISTRIRERYASQTVLISGESGAGKMLGAGTPEMVTGGSMSRFVYVDVHFPRIMGDIMGLTMVNP